MDRRASSSRRRSRSRIRPTAHQPAHRNWRKTLRRARSSERFGELKNVDVIQPDITQCGGILEVKKIASTAETYSIMVAPHNVGGIISTMAALHLCLTLRNVKILEHFNDFADPHVKNAGTNYPEVVDGYFPVPDKPGWGVELNEEFIDNQPPNYTETGVIADPGLNMFENADWAKRGQTD